MFCGSIIIEPNAISNNSNLTNMGLWKIVNDGAKAYDMYQDAKQTEGEQKGFEEWFKKLKKNYQKEGLHPDDYLIVENNIWNDESIKFIVKFLKKHGHLMNKEVFSSFTTLILKQAEKSNFDITNYLESM